MLVFAQNNRFGDRIRSLFLNGTDVTRDCTAFDAKTGIAFLVRRNKAGHIVQGRTAKRGRIEFIRDSDFPSAKFGY